MTDAAVKLLIEEGRIHGRGIQSQIGDRAGELSSRAEAPALDSSRRKRIDDMAF